MTATEIPETRYAKSGEVSIAYQVFGEGELDIVFVPAFVTNLELGWNNPLIAAGRRRLAEFARVIIFDKRGTGLSDRVGGGVSLETRMDDLRAVMDAVRSERAAVVGLSEGGAMSILFAATYPERVLALVLTGVFPRLTRAPDFPWGFSPGEFDRDTEALVANWGTEKGVRELFGWMGGSPANDQLAALAHVQRMSASPGAVAALREMNKEIDVRAVLPSVTVPTLILHRSGEPLDVRAARWVADRISGARFVELEGSVHGLFQEHDLDFVIQTMRDFLGEASNAPPLENANGRVLATVLFTDLVGSTERAIEFGPRWADLLREHNTTIRRELTRYAGREIDTAGDGFFASGFDGPERAIRCACAIRDAVGELGLDIRVGVHTGECEVVDGKLAGLAVVVGARVAAHAEPGEVLVSGTVKDLVAGSGIAFEPRGARELKGLGEWPVYAVARA